MPSVNEGNDMAISAHSRYGVRTVRMYGFHQNACVDVMEYRFDENPRP